MTRKPPTDLPDTDDPYVLLDVRPGASEDQIRRAYMRRVKVFKPDRHPAEFRRVREAYDRIREQEAWFDAWRRAGEVIRQAADDGEADPEEASGHAPTPSPDQAADPTEAAADAWNEHDDHGHDDDIVTGFDHDARADRRRRVAHAATVAERLERLDEAVQAKLGADRTAAAADLLLEPEVELLAGQEAFGTLLLEVCCAAVWAEPARFDALAARFGDLVMELDTEFRDGALLHRRTLTDERAAWCEAVQGWPELERFVVQGSSLRGSAEAELGLRLGKRAAHDSEGLLDVLQRAGRAAPGIVALYVGMAERWAQHYWRPVTAPRSAHQPTIDQAAEAVALALRSHRRVRWEQLRPLLAVATTATLLWWASSPLFELLLIGTFVVLWAWHAWASDPEQRLYLRVVQPTAATWLWATGASPNELAAALEARLPPTGSWAALLQPADPSVYPQMLANDLTLLAFGVTAPMVPRLLGSGRNGRA